MKAYAQVLAAQHTDGSDVTLEQIKEISRKVTDFAQAECKKHGMLFMTLTPCPDVKPNTPEQDAAIVASGLKSHRGLNCDLYNRAVRAAYLLKDEEVTEDVLK